MDEIRTRTYRRLKSRYPTAQKAWLDIRRSIKGDYRGIKAAHTRRYWVFLIT